MKSTVVLAAFLAILFAIHVESADRAARVDAKDLT